VRSDALAWSRACGPARTGRAVRLAAWPRCPPFGWRSGASWAAKEGASGTRALSRDAPAGALLQPPNRWRLGCVQLWLSSARCRSVGYSFRTHQMDRAAALLCVGRARAGSCGACVESMLVDPHGEAARVASRGRRGGRKPLVGHWRCRPRIHDALTVASRASRQASRRRRKPSCAHHNPRLCARFRLVVAAGVHCRAGPWH
jgi:hypothetical protein